jgi:hypothetical protein
MTIKKKHLSFYKFYLLINRKPTKKINFYKINIFFFKKKKRERVKIKRYQQNNYITQSKFSLAEIAHEIRSLKLEDFTI